MSTQYLTILRESLEKKLNILDEIIRISKIQTELLSKESVDFEEYDRCVDDKDVCIEQIERLDYGFETLFQKVKPELDENRAGYADWIAEAKRLIMEVTDKSVEIQALEARNKQAIDEMIKKSRRGFQQGKRSMEVAKSYHRSMNPVNVASSQYMDKRK